MKTVSKQELKALSDRYVTFLGERDLHGEINTQKGNR
nr:MAG TPA: hypothetical protein [Caudoviricetes sp.]